MRNRILLIGMAFALMAGVALTAEAQEARGRGQRGSGEVQRPAPSLNALAGPDRIVMPGGTTYLNGWVGYGEGPGRRRRGRRGRGAQAAAEIPRPEPTASWTKVSGPGDVTFEDADAAVTSAVFSAPGDYVLMLTAANGEATAESTFSVRTQSPPPAGFLEPVHTKTFKIDNPLWNHRAKALIVNWIPFCIEQIADPELREGGLNNIIDAGKRLSGEPGGEHRGYVFSNAWVLNTVEAMSVALRLDAGGDAEIAAAQAKMREALDDWIPMILAAQEPDGYFQTAYTLRDPERWAERWAPRTRGNHEGYVAGYFLEAAVAHHLLTDGADTRLYDAAKRLADCWEQNLGPAPKKPWYDGHQEMEIALVRFGRYVNEVEGADRGEKYIDLAKFLLDSRANGSSYDQSHLPVIGQYESAGHAVRAVYSYAGMADVAMETGDRDYQSAVASLWDNIVNRKYYVTGGVGSGQTSEGFGPDFSLRNNGYCESCSSAGEIFFQHRLNRTYRDAKYADLYEETLYNALLGSVDLEGNNFFYQNPLDTRGARYPWHGCPCCVGNIPRTLLSLPTWTYLKGEDSLYVNLFIGSTMTVEGVAGTDVEMVQTTDYPWSGDVAIEVNPAAEANFSLRIRVPNREVSALYTNTPKASGIGAITVNGEAVRTEIEKGYAVITRDWKAGDTVEFTLPMIVQVVRADERIEAAGGKIALRYGPLIYNVERVDQDIDRAIDTEAPLTAEWAPDLLGGVMVIKGSWADGSPLTAIPNYARKNRDPVEPPRTGGGGRGGRGARPASSIVWIGKQ